MTGDLTTSEIEFVKSAERGEPYVGDVRKPLRAEVVATILEDLAKNSSVRRLTLRATKVTGVLDLSGREIWSGIELHSCDIDTIRLRNSRIPWLTLRNVKVGNTVDLANVTMSGNLMLTDHCRVVGSSPNGAVNLQGSRVEGDIFISAIRIANSLGPALNLYQSVVSGTVEVDTDIKLVGSSIYGCVIFAGARIGGDLRLTGIRADNPLGHSIRTDSARVENDVILRRVDVQTDYRGTAVEMGGLTAGGNLSVIDSRIWSASAPALSATECRVGRGCYILNSDFKSRAAHGGVRLSGMQAKGLSISETRFQNDEGTALDAEGLEMDDHVLIRASTARSGGSRNALNLAYSRIRGGLDFEGTKARNSSPEGYSVDLREVTAGRVLLPDSLACRSGESDPATWLADGAIDLDHFTYSSFARNSSGVDQWLRWLRSSPEYAAHPYRQLAAVHGDSGHEATARRVLIEQQDALVERRVQGEGGARISKKALRITLGYGYQTWRAFTALLIVVLSSVLLALAAGAMLLPSGRNVASHTAKTSHQGTACSVVERIGLGIDRSVPILNTGTRERCDVDPTSSMGQVFTVAFWLLQLAAWALTTLVIVSYTGLVRRL
ncbi:hypothetical protein [Micromonospora tulbaghiae]|uniref:hypothetical protein n=1 Tax=Micromonospora tulbaghiae TaxID=479978 RepID=UPI00371680B1